LNDFETRNKNKKNKRKQKKTKENKKKNTIKYIKSQVYIFLYYNGK